MAALNVMDGRTERGERFFFELMRHGKRALLQESYESRNIIPKRRRCVRERRDNNKHNSVMKGWPLMNDELEANFSQGLKRNISVSIETYNRFNKWCSEEENKRKRQKDREKNSS